MCVEVDESSEEIVTTEFTNPPIPPPQPSPAINDNSFKPSSEITAPIKSENPQKALEIQDDSETTSL